MNLYQIEVTDNSWQRVIPYAILIIVIVFAVSSGGCDPLRRYARSHDAGSLAGAAKHRCSRTP
jgi:hypothetical protein